MSDDDRQIRELVATWMTATKAGDVDTVLSLLTDDAVTPPGGKAAAALVLVLALGGCDDFDAAFRSP